MSRGITIDSPTPARVQVSEAQRARVLSAAALVVGESGYGGMSVARVCARAGVSRRTFYDLYSDREDCFLAVFEDALLRVSSVVGTAYLEVSGSWRERVRAGLGALLCLFDEEPGLGSLLVVDALAGGPRVLARRARVLEVLAGVVDRGGAGRARGAARPGLMAEGVVGAVFSVVHARMLHTATPASPLRPLSGLLNELMGMIVLPYEGAAASRRELSRPLPRPARRRAARDGAAGYSPLAGNPLEGLPMRLTYRTLRVLSAIASDPGASNREVGLHAGVHDQGQISKLLARLDRLGLIANQGPGQHTGEPNAWVLTARGREVQAAIGAQVGGASERAQRS